MSSEILYSQAIPTDGTIQELLILRPDNLGDVVLFSGALKAIREKWATSRITICVKRFVRDYLRLCPYVDDILIWEEVSSFLYSPLYKRQILRLIRLMAGWSLENVARSAFDLLAKCDLSFDLLLFPVRSPSWDHHMFVRAVQASVKIGISGDWCNQSFNEDQAATKIYTTRYNLTTDRQWEHELKVTRDFLNFLGIDADLEDVRPEMWTNESDVKAARMMVPDAAGTKLAIIPGANWTGRTYPPDGIVSAISEITDRRLSCCIFGSSNEVSLCGELHAKLSKCHNVQEIVDLSGRTTVRTLIESLRLCDVVLSAESAPLHIATAIGKPTVGIIGGGHFGRFYPWGDPEINRVVCKPMDCYSCNWDCPNSNAPCVKDIPTSAITCEIDYLAHLLKKRKIAV